MTSHKKIATHQYIVWFNIRMKDAAALQQLQSEEQLLGVGANGLDMQSNVLAIFLQNLSQVHAEKGRGNINSVLF